MTDVLIRNVSESTLGRLKERAASNGRSLQQELLAIVDEASRIRPLEALESARKVRRRLARSRPDQSDSARLVRVDRDR